MIGRIEPTFNDLVNASLAESGIPMTIGLPTSHPFFSFFFPRTEVLSSLTNSMHDVDN